MQSSERLTLLVLYWGARLVVGLALLAGASVAYTQDAPPDAPPTTEQAPPSDEGRQAAGIAATAPDAAAPALRGTPLLLATTTPAPQLSGTCSSAYGVYADSSGRYPAGGCAATGIVFGPDSGLSLGGSAVAPCQLFASASQPTTSSLATPVVGAPLPAALSVAPPCPSTSAGRSGFGGNGVPACLLYPSASQPTTRSFGAANYPVTPAPAPAQSTSTRASLAGAGC
jgi:hypothetical protein